MRGAGKGFDVSQQIHTYCGIACVSKVVQSVSTCANVVCPLQLPASCGDTADHKGCYKNCRGNFVKSIYCVCFRHLTVW